MKYNLTLKTAPTKEPLTLSEVKDFLKITDFGETCNSILSEECILSASRNIGTVNGNSVDISGYEATIELISGELQAGGKLDVKLQDSNDNAIWEDVYSFTQITTSNDNQNFLYKYTGDKKYLRCVGVLTTAGGVYGVNIILSIGYTEEDTYLESLIVAAREYVETYQGRALITQTWEMTFNSFMEDMIYIPLGKLQTIDSIKYTDSDNVVTTLTEHTDYIVSLRGILGLACPAYNKSWPIFTPYPLDAIVITFTCGYGDNATDIPVKTIQAMKLLISHWYKNRIPVDATQSSAKEIEFTLSSLLWQERILDI